jgi:hypothetical protein
VNDAMPATGLFEGKDWLISPDAFPLSPATVADLEELGPAIHAFNLACSRLYLASAEGAQPRWVAELLDRGKPGDLIEFARKKRFAEETPAVLRPDIIVAEDRLAVTELDSLPGGIGVTAWMNQTYSAFDPRIIGGRSDMIDAFARLLEGGDVIISREAQGYRPEMDWLIGETNRLHPELGGNRVIDAWNFSADQAKSRAYRYFELWDLANVEHAADFMRLAAEGATRFTPPFKPIFEEKLWLALFWSVPLRPYWIEALGAERVEFLGRHFPFGWVVDPTPIPPHGEIPRLKINSWTELGRASQKDRQLALKISGFSEEAWGSHGVYIGHDLSTDDWKKALEDACNGFDRHPYVLQEFHKGRIVEQDYLDRETGELRRMKGRVRLCPYYFVENNEARLKGVMATVCPSDKKLIHGMKDAIITPCALSETGY